MQSGFIEIAIEVLAGGAWWGWSIDSASNEEFECAMDFLVVLVGRSDCLGDHVAADLPVLTREQHKIVFALDIIDSNIEEVPLIQLNELRVRKKNF